MTNLLLYGLWALQMPLSLTMAGLIISTALFVQWGCSLWWKLPHFDLRSPLISALSLCLLLRTDSLMIAIGITTIAILSKFIFRWEGRHIFNPTNFGLVVALLLNVGWVSPGQWGRDILFVAFLACLGMLVVYRAVRPEVPLGFLTVYAACLFGRAFWLGDPFAIPVHQLQNGGILLFAFFMLSDPKTTPNSLTGRWVFSGMIAILGFVLQISFYHPQGLLWALAMGAMFVPVLNALFPDSPYQWPGKELKEYSKFSVFHQIIHGLTIRRML